MAGSTVRQSNHQVSKNREVNTMGMCTIRAVVAASVVAIFVSGSAFAADRANKDEAVAMVKKAVAAIKANGDKAYADITAKGGPFTDRDLYIVVYKTDGVVLAHGQNETLVGKNLSDAKDPEGKPFVAERIELAKKGAPFWQDYKYMDPLTKKSEPKQMYCEPVNDTAVCGGIYKL
jgi:cytochrome c